MVDGVLSANIQAMLQSLPERSSLGGVQRKRVELLTLRLAAPMAPMFHLLPRPEDLITQCVSSAALGVGEAQQSELAQEGKEAMGRARLAEFMGENSWRSIPPDADPATLLPEKRRMRKREQILSIVRACAAVMLAVDATLRPGAGGSSGAASVPRRAVDFAGGCGHVGVLLAWLFPGWEVVCVDTNPRSLALGSRRAAALGLDNYRAAEADIRDFSEPLALGVALHACGSASDYAIAACLARRAALVVCPCCVGKVGMTDWAAASGATGDAGGGGHAPCRAQSRRMRRCLRHVLRDMAKTAATARGAASGGREAREGAPEEADGGRAGPVGTPRHDSEGGGRPDGEEDGDLEGGESEEEGDGEGAAARRRAEGAAFVELARAADFGDRVAGQEGWWRRLAKALVEADRLHRILEAHAGPGWDSGGPGGGGYDGRVCKMEPLAASPKNDVIVAWPAALLPLLPAAFRPATAAGPEPAERQRAAAEAEHAAAAADAAGGAPLRPAQGAGPMAAEGDEDEGPWDVALGDGAAAVPRARLEELTARLARLAAGGAGRARLALDDVRGARERKLAHALAERLGLRHWSEGRGAARRVVVGNYEGAAAGRSNGRGGRGLAGAPPDGAGPPG